MTHTEKASARTAPPGRGRTPVWVWPVFGVCVAALIVVTVMLLGDVAGFWASPLSGPAAQPIIVLAGLGGTVAGRRRASGMART